MDLPELGVGITYNSELDAFLDGHAGLVDVVEIEPQTLWFESASESAKYKVDSATIEHLRDTGSPKLLHGIGFPVGGCRPPDSSQIPLLKEMLSALGSPWMSEHLSFNRASGEKGEFNTGFLLPPLQTPEGVEAAVSSVRSMMAQIPVPLAVETGVNYLKPRPNEMHDGAFVSAVAEGADCGILLDLHNLWTNEFNGRQRVTEFLDELPLERVWEVHLAGGFKYKGYWLDSHSGGMPESLFESAQEIVQRLPNLHAIIFEVFPSYIAKIGFNALSEELERVHRLWDLRGRSRSSRKSAHKLNHTLESPISPRVWEDTLGALVVGWDPEGSLSTELKKDPGLLIIRDLIAEFRSSMIVSAMKMTTRLLILTFGETKFTSLLEDYWRESTPELFASAEGARFAAFLSKREHNVPYVKEVAGFEKAVLETLLDGKTRVVDFEHDPLRLLRALGDGHLPGDLEVGSFEVEITPDIAGQSVEPKDLHFRPVMH